MNSYFRIWGPVNVESRYPISFKLLTLKVNNLEHTINGGRIINKARRPPIPAVIKKDEIEVEVG
jgi:hypothetical protein